MTTLALTVRMKKFFSFVKIEHTLFSLPVVYAGMALAIHASQQRLEPTPGGAELVRLGLWILVAATGARTAGFAMNRLIDRHIDARNPRTKDRDLPAGRMSLAEGYGVMAVGIAIYFLAAWQLNDLCLMLSPIPLAVFLIYPFMKRFTALAHFGVGLSLALAPLGAYLAVRPTMDGALPAILLSVFTWLWVSGFDIIYSTADEQFDKQEGLYSMPSRYGAKRALQLSAILHVMTFSMLVWLYLVAFSGAWLPGVLMVIAGVLLYFEQKLATDVELAFFKINAVLGFVVFLFVITGVTIS